MQSEPKVGRDFNRRWGKAKFSGPYTMTRRIEILVETRRRLVVRRVSEGQRSWCDLCLAEVQMITPDKPQP